jgi:hypothetical protein
MSKGPTHSLQELTKTATHLPVVTEDLLDVGHLAQAEPLLVQATAAKNINKSLIIRLTRKKGPGWGEYTSKIISRLLFLSVTSCFFSFCPHYTANY